MSVITDFQRMHDQHVRTLTTSTKCYKNTVNKMSVPWLQSLTCVSVYNTDLVTTRSQH